MTFIALPKIAPVAAGKRYKRFENKEKVRIIFQLNVQFEDPFNHLCNYQKRFLLGAPSAG